jgi:hypothetical protein
MLEIVAFCGLLGFSIAVTAQGGAASDAKKLKDQLTGDAAAKAASNPQCKLFTQVEIARYVGEPVQPGENAAGGSACQWSSKDGEADAMVQVVPSSYLVPPKLAKGFKAVPGLGAKGYVVPEMGGWAAGAVDGEVGVVVSVSGKNAKEDAAVALLQETIRRRKP